MFLVSKIEGAAFQNSATMLARRERNVCVVRGRVQRREEALPGSCENYWGGNCPSDIYRRDVSWRVFQATDASRTPIRTRASPT